MDMTPMTAKALGRSLVWATIIPISYFGVLNAITHAQTNAPQNPYLASSINPISHGTSAQQDSVPTGGPQGPTHRLSASEIRYTHLGPAHFGTAISSPYPNGRRVLWSNGLNGIYKADHDSLEILGVYPSPDGAHYSPAHAEEKISAFNKRTTGPIALAQAISTARMLRNLSSVYTLLDKGNRYYVGDKIGKIVIYGDAETGNSNSNINKLNSYDLPSDVTGNLVGMNMTFDGWLIVATEHGFIVAISRDFKTVRTTRLKHSEGSGDKASAAIGYGWVRNGFAIDEQGGIYVASQNHMHKVIWTGDHLSTDPQDGAWTAEYRNGTGHGTGATPSLMGFGEEDRFVVITDGDPVMNVDLFWRDQIPPDWQQLPDTPSRRIAGQQPANMGDPNIIGIQSEQSVVVEGYGALVVNNIPRNVPWYAPKQAHPLYISFLGSNPKHQPFGMQKFSWNPTARALKTAWVNNQISSPNGVPLVSSTSNLVYLIGARNNEWTLEAVDWTTGEEAFHYVIGDQRYNSLYSATLLDENGHIMYGSTWGRVHLRPVER